MSGSKDTLLCPRPLRTVRASFPAYGSSLCKPTYADQHPRLLNQIGKFGGGNPPPHDHALLRLSKKKIIGQKALIVSARSIVIVILRSTFIGNSLKIRSRRREA